METATFTARGGSLGSYMNPASMVRSLWASRGLIWQFALREVQGRYKGHGLGMLWAVITPLLMLGIYTFVFGVIFQARAASVGVEPGLGGTALYIFSGLLVFGVFREMVGKSPGVVVGHPNYVKKVVFPLEILPVSNLLVALMTFGIGSCVWVAGYVVLTRSPPPATIMLSPLLLLPVCLLALGLSWVIASLAVFIRDIGNVMDLLLMMLFFLTPIFYRIDFVPEPYRTIIGLNPLAHAITGVRGVAIEGRVPGGGEALLWMVWLIVSGVAALGGYGFFQKSRRAFNDVL